MREIIAIACGGALGALSRHAVSLGAKRLLGDSFPWGTLLVNVVGCLLLGAAAELALTRKDWSPAVYRGVTVGFLGALTTFSTFGHETFRRLEDGRMTLAVSNIVANLSIGLIAVWLGVLAGRALTGSQQVGS